MHFYRVQVLAIILKIVVPQTIYIAWGLPFGTHYIHLSWFAFLLFFIVGLIFGAFALFKGIKGRAT